MKNSNIIERIKELCQDDYIKHNLQRFLDLAILVDKNYEHIEQLETLTRLFEGGLSAYYKEYHSNENELAEIISVVCDNTRANYYKKEEDLLFPSIYDVQLSLFGKENKIVSYKQLSYAK